MDGAGLIIRCDARFAERELGTAALMQAEARAIAREQQRLCNEQDECSPQ